MITDKRQTKQKERKLSFNEKTREIIEALGQVQNVKETLRKFDELQYEKPKVYTTQDIVALRERKMRMSQGVFASICNAKLSTVQKWERGVTKPTPPINRLFQLIEHRALDLIKR